MTFRIQPVIFSMASKALNNQAPAYHLDLHNTALSYISVTSTTLRFTNCAKPAAG